MPSAHAEKCPVPIARARAHCIAVPAIHRRSWLCPWQVNDGVLIEPKAVSPCSNFVAAAEAAAIAAPSTRSAAEPRPAPRTTLEQAKKSPYKKRCFLTKDASRAHAHMPPHKRKTAATSKAAAEEVGGKEDATKPPADPAPPPPAVLPEETPRQTPVGDPPPPGNPMPPQEEVPEAYHTRRTMVTKAFAEHSLQDPYETEEIAPDLHPWGPEGHTFGDTLVATAPAVVEALRDCTGVLVVTKLNWRSSGRRDSVAESGINVGGIKVGVIKRGDYLVYVNQPTDAKKEACIVLIEGFIVILEKGAITRKITVVRNSLIDVPILIVCIGTECPNECVNA